MNEIRNSVPKGMKTCKTCGKLIAKNAKVCPNCGAKQKGGIAKIIIIVIVALLLISLVSGGNKNASKDRQPAKETGAVPVVEDKEPAKEGQEAEHTQEEQDVGEPAEEKEAEPEIEYEEVTVQEMFDELESNALKAKDRFKGKYLEITGTLGAIDSSGKYITLEPDEYSIIGVSCYLKNDDQMNQVANMSAGDTVTLRGKCTDVGEVLGYYLDIDSIDGYEEGEGLSFDTTDDGYLIVSAEDLAGLANENPLRARNRLKDEKIELTGILKNIDSDGKYLDVGSEDPMDFTIIQCYIKNEEQKSLIMDMSTGDTVIIRGKCKDVGELMGYSIDVEEIVTD